MSDTAIANFMNALPGRFDPAAAGGASASVQFYFTGDSASDWYLEFDEAACRTSPGAHPDPTVTLTVDSDVFMALLSGELQPMAAFMQGKLKLRGDVGLAMKIPAMFNRD